MGARETLYFTKEYSSPPGKRIPRVSIKSVDQADLILRLGEVGINIHPEHSEKSIEYQSLNLLRRSFIPFEVTVPEYVKVTEYFLRDLAGFELRVRDYHKARQRETSGSVLGDLGIMCDLASRNDICNGTGIILKTEEVVGKLFRETPENDFYVVEPIRDGRSLRWSVGF